MSGTGSAGAVWPAGACGPRARIPVLIASFVLAVGGGCSSRYKKLSQGGSVTDVLFYDVLGLGLCSPDYYYTLVRSSHREKDFCYECAAGDPYLVDKNIDAVEHLGRAGYGRLEGLGEVVELFSEVIMEDRSALARAQAATSLTQIGLKIPRYDYLPIEDDGKRLLSLMREVDRLYVGQGGRTARGACPPASKGVLVSRIGQIGNLEFASTDLRFYRQSIQFFYGRPYLVDEQDPQIREAIDTALTKRIGALIQISLVSAVDDGEPQVRQDAIRGLKTLGDPAGVDAVAQRLRFESHWLVRMEAAEYLGRVGTRTGVTAIIFLLEDANASVRHKAHEALMQVAGADYGTRAESWRWWARRQDPTLEFEDEARDGGDAPGADPSSPFP